MRSLGCAERRGGGNGEKSTRSNGANGGTTGDRWFARLEHKTSVRPPFHSELFLVRAGSGAPTVARLSADDGRESKYPDVALRGNRVALTWYDTKDGNTEVYLFTGDATATSGELDDRARRVTRTNGASIGTTKPSMSMTPSTPRLTI